MVLKRKIWCPSSGGREGELAGAAGNNSAGRPQGGRGRSVPLLCTNRVGPAQVPGANMFDLCANHVCKSCVQIIFCPSPAGAAGANMFDLCANHVYKSCGHLGWAQDPGPRTPGSLDPGPMGLPGLGYLGWAATGNPDRQG